jgi:hypothetical protein
VGEEVSGPSNETEAEQMMRRLTEAVERLADLMALVVDADMGSIGITPSMRADNPLEVEIIEKP